MGATVGDFFWERLHQWGVRRVFGYPGLHVVDGSIVPSISHYCDLMNTLTKGAEFQIQRIIRSLQSALNLGSEMG